MMSLYTIGMSILILAVAFASGATEGPREVLVTPDSAAKLGFSVLSERDDSGVLIVTVKGPAIDSQGCRPSRSGVTLLNGDRELLVSITELPESNSGPTQMGYAAHSDQMQMFFDYLRCPESVHPPRYRIQSTDAFTPSPK